ncbi:MAG TPA: cyclodeaminase/cyclohydrolase family protein [Candidatus Limnocylindria bacterium]|jgi:formiminotetrahydrofolate cyclodeaminase
METRLADLSVADLVARLATHDPIPGGGSASALTGAMAAALVQMVVELTRGRPAAEGREDELTEIGVAAAGFQSELVRLAEVDAAAYRTVLDARRLPRETERDREARRVQVDAATREAIRAPMATADRASRVLDIAWRLAPIGNRNAISDVGVGAELAAAAIRGALLNVEINLPYLPEDDALRPDAEGLVRELRGGLDRREREIRAAVAERLA